MTQSNSPFLISEDQIKQLFIQEPLDIWVNSFGGCRSNFVRDLIKDKFRTYNAAYEYKACHYIKPLEVNVQAGIFCFVEDVGTAVTSQINRGMFHNFQKLNDDNSEYSIETWLNKIDQQIDNWTTPNSYFPVIMINTDKLQNHTSEFEEIFGIKVEGFKPRTTKEYNEEVAKHQDLIDKINSKLKSLPEFQIIR